MTAKLRLDLLQARLARLGLASIAEAAFLPRLVLPAGKDERERVNDTTESKKHHHHLLSESYQAPAGRGEALTRPGWSPICTPCIPLILLIFEAAKRAMPVEGPKEPNSSYSDSGRNEGGSSSLSLRFQQPVRRAIILPPQTPSVPIARPSNTKPLLHAYRESRQLLISRLASHYRQQGDLRRYICILEDAETAQALSRISVGVGGH